MFRRIRNQWRYRVTVLYMYGSSLSPSSFAMTPILPFFHLYSCNLSKHKTLETWNKHVLQLKKADQKNIVLFIFGWLEFPMKKNKILQFFLWFYSNWEQKLSGAEFLNIWMFWIQEHSVSMLKYSSTLSWLNVEEINGVNGFFHAFLLM